MENKSKSRNKLSLTQSIDFVKKYLFIWLHQVLVAARGIFIAACGIF